MKTFPVNMKFIKPGALVRATVCRYIYISQFVRYCMWESTLFTLPSQVIFHITCIRMYMSSGQQKLVHVVHHVTKTIYVVLLASQIFGD